MFLDMLTSKMSSKRRLETSLGGVSMTWMLKESTEKLRLPSQSALLFPSRHVWLKCICQFNFKSSCIRRIKVVGLPLILIFPMIISARVFELLSTWRWWKPCFQASCIPKYIPHISTQSASQFSILRVYPLSHLPSEF